MNVPAEQESNQTPFEEPGDDSDVQTPYADDDPGEEHEVLEVDLFNDYDRYISSKVLLPVGGKHMGSAKVISRALDTDGIAAGTHNNNPMLDARIYNAMFPDGAE